jgi:uncharacterized coiled-coil protein SlyX
MDMTKTLTACTHPNTNITAYVQPDGEVFITDSLICDILDIDQEELDMLIARCDDPNLYNRVEDYPELATIGGIQRISGLRNAVDFVPILRVWNPVSSEGKQHKEEIVYQLAEWGVVDYFHFECGRGDLVRPEQVVDYEDRIFDLQFTIAKQDLAIAKQAQAIAKQAQAIAEQQQLLRDMAANQRNFLEQMGVKLPPRN